MQNINDGGLAGAIIERELSELLGVNIDVVSTGGLRARDSHILKESIEL